MQGARLSTPHSTGFDQIQPGSTMRAPGILQQTSTQTVIQALKNVSALPVCLFGKKFKLHENLP
jgi:hypothetical protein